MQDQLKHYVNTLLKVNVHLFSAPIPVSSEKFTGITKVISTIKGQPSAITLISLSLTRYHNIYTVQLHSNHLTSVSALHAIIIHTDQLHSNHHQSDMKA